MTTTAIDKYEPDKAESAATLAHTSAQALDAALRSMPIPNAAAAVAAAKQVKARRLAFERERDDFAKPLRALATKHSKRWNPVIKVLKDLEAHLKGEALALEQAARDEQIKALHAAQTADEIVAATSVPVESGLGKRTDWTWEVVNADEIPDEYWVLDKFRIDREARDEKG